MPAPAPIPATAVEITSPSAIMFTALAGDPFFLRRVTGILELMAAQIVNTTIGQGTPPVTAGQQAYARLIIASPAQYANTWTQYLVHRSNIIGANIWVDLSTGQPCLFSDATDAAIESQIISDWPSVSGA
jgi:hypothetical protein